MQYYEILDYDTPARRGGGPMNTSIYIYIYVCIHKTGTSHPNNDKENQDLNCSVLHMNDKETKLNHYTKIVSTNPRTITIYEMILHCRHIKGSSTETLVQIVRLYI